MNIARSAAFLIWPSTGSFVLTLAIVAIAAVLVVRYIKTKGNASDKKIEAYPQTTSVRTNIQTAKTDDENGKKE